MSQSSCTAILPYLFTFSDLSCSRKSVGSYSLKLLQFSVALHYFEGSLFLNVSSFFTIHPVSQYDMNMSIGYEYWKHQ